MPLGVIHRQLQSGLDGFGTAVRKVRFRGPFDRDNFIKLLPECGHVAVIKIGAAKVDQLGRLIADRFYDVRVTMAGRANGDAGVAVEKYVAVRVFYPDAVAFFGDEFVVRTRIARRYVSCIGIDDLAGLRPREFRFNKWSLSFG